MKANNDPAWMGLTFMLKEVRRAASLVGFGVGVEADTDSEPAWLGLSFMLEGVSRPPSLSGSGH